LFLPVDAPNQRRKHQEKHDYFFGSYDVNRVQFTQGRDLRLAPAQEGPDADGNYLRVGGPDIDQILVSDRP